MYMTDISDEAEFDKFADAMDENFMASGDALKCAYLLVAGEMDELTTGGCSRLVGPAQRSERIMDVRGCASIPWAKSLQIFTRALPIGLRMS